MNMQIRDMPVREIQEALVRAGFDPGPIDGVWGRATLAAVKAFQAREGLEVDGIVGPQTMAALQRAVAGKPLAQPLPWMEEATRLINTREMIGGGDNPRILDWAESLDLEYAGDEVPWCGLFVGHCIGATLPSEVLPNGLLLAQSWRRFGDATTPRRGAVMVFWRESRESGLGHVGFYVGESSDAYYILGGNQGDSVCYIWMPRQRLLDARWPKTAKSLLAVADKVEMAKSGQMSEKET
nr:TIGR02594 family protein [uncultured Massilia sp.]